MVICKVVYYNQYVVMFSRSLENASILFKGLTLCLEFNKNAISWVFKMQVWKIGYATSIF